MKLYDVRCPLMRKKYDNKPPVKCNRLCLQAAAGSSGEIQCSTCRQTFEFHIDDPKQLNSIIVNREAIGPSDTIA